jgi:hypothetical protein
MREVSRAAKPRKLPPSAETLLVENTRFSEALWAIERVVGGMSHRADGHVDGVDVAGLCSRCRITRLIDEALRPDPSTSSPGDSK